MRSRRLALTIGGGVALLVLGGLWIGHTLEYVRVWGTPGLETELAGSVHAYMVPFALLLILAAAFASGRWWRVWMRLGVRLDDGQRALAALLRGKQDPSGMRVPSERLPSLPARVITAWPALALAQIIFYVIQENVEAALAGVPAPGLGAITGVHAYAPLVQAAVALLLLVWGRIDCASPSASLIRCRCRRSPRPLAACEAPS